MIFKLNKSNVIPIVYKMLNILNLTSLNKIMIL